MARLPGPPGALPLIGLTIAFDRKPWLAAVPALAMLGGFVVPYVRARAEALGVKLPPLFMRRPERVVLLVLSLVLGALPLGPLAEIAMLVGLGVMAALAYAGGVWALLVARRELLGPEQRKPPEDHVSSAHATASGP